MLNNYSLILKKELTDIFRDKRSFVTLFIPVFLFPMMYFLMGTQLNNKDLKKDIACIVDCQTESDRALFDSVCENPAMQGILKEYPEEITEEKEMYSTLKDGEVYSILRVENNTITIIYNQDSNKSTTASNNIRNCLSVVANEMLTISLNENGVSFEKLNSLAVDTKNLFDLTGEGGNALLASIAPMMLVVVIMSSGISIAIDLFAGEKERGTFESLLTTQVDRMSLLLAKFTAIFAIGMLSMLLSITAYVISFKLNPSALIMYTGNADSSTDQIEFTALQFAQVLIVCFSLSVLAVSIMTFIGLHAKSVKEAQSQMSIVTIFPTLLSGLTIFMESSDINNAAMLIPIFNSIIAIKSIFLNTIEPIQLFFVAASCIVYSVIICVFCVRMLNSEKILR